MLTLEQIRNISFHKAKKDGYQPEEVDSFIDEVVAAFEAILTDRVSTKRKLESLEKDLAACKARESSVGEALLSAQHQADVVLSEAQSRADLMIEEAKIQASNIVAGTHGEVEEQKEIAVRLREEIAAFKGRLLQLYREHLTLIDALPDDRDLPKDDVQPAAAEAAPAVQENIASVPSQSAEASAPVQPQPVPEAPAVPSAAAVPSDPAPAASVPQEPVPAEPEAEPEKAVFAAAPEAAPAVNPFVPQSTAQAKPLVQFTDELSSKTPEAPKPKMPALFSDDDFAPTSASPARFQALQFGDNYEEPNASSGGLFHRKK